MNPRNAIYAVILGLFAVSASAGGRDQVFEDIHKCDEFAAHPDDPGKWASGVSETDLIPGPAVKFCREAVRDHPGTPRFYFQLGRALLKANEFEGAIDALADAAEKDYAPAYKYLGDLYQSGLLGEPDEEKAAKYYEIAAAGGFQPAEEELLETEEGADVSLSMRGLPREETRVAKAAGRPPSGGAIIDQAAVSVENQQHPLRDATSFDPSPFSRGGYLLKLYEGDFDQLERESQDFLIVYLLKLNDSFSQSFNFHSASCSAFADPDLKPGVSRKVTGALMGGGGNNPQQVANLYLGMVKDLTQNPGGAINRVSHVEAAQNAAERDATRLAQLYSCASPVFQRLYANIVNYVKDRDPAFASGWPGLRLACQNYAKSEGGQDADTRERCTCVVGTFKESGVSLDEAEWLQVNYDHGANFFEVVGRHDGLSNKLGSCLL
jgi:TPR repeat protein